MPPTADAHLKANIAKDRICSNSELSSSSIEGKRLPFVLCYTTSKHSKGKSSRDKFANDDTY